MTSVSTCPDSSLLFERDSDIPLPISYIFGFLKQGHFVEKTCSINFRRGFQIAKQKVILKKEFLYTIVIKFCCGSDVMLQTVLNFGRGNDRVGF